MKLWYREPAEKWTEALPIGNGRLGAMVFGGVVEERLQLNVIPYGQVVQRIGIIHEQKRFYQFRLKQK